MGKIIVHNSLTLDGVMQAPGRADEDTRGDFTHGGWAIPYFDPIMFSPPADGKMPDLLFGRRTYEDFYQVWPNRNDGNPFTEVLNNSQKYVASTTLPEPLPWMNSTLLTGDVPAAVARLKQHSDNNLVILGSGVLIQSLLPHNLIDVFELLIHPLILGTGRRLFPDGSPFAALKLVDTKIASTGVIIATYHPTEGGA